jgi:hypothetical protein
MEESESDCSSNDNSRSFAAVGQSKLAIQAVMELVLAGDVPEPDLRVRFLHMASVWEEMAVQRRVLH